MTAPGKFLGRGGTEASRALIPRLADGGGGFLHAKLFCLEIGIVEAVEQEIHQIRNNGLGSFGFRRSTRWLLAAGRNFTRISPTTPTLGFLSSVMGRLSKSSMIWRQSLRNLSTEGSVRTNFLQTASHFCAWRWRTPSPAHRGAYGRGSA